jgi:hypothetical protein
MCKPSLRVQRAKVAMGVSGYRLLRAGLTGATTRWSPAAAARSRRAVGVWLASPPPCRSALTAAAMMHSVSAGTEFSWPDTALTNAPS